MKAPTCRPRLSGLFAAALWFLAPPTIMLAATEVTATEGTAPSARAERLAAMARFQKACAEAGQPAKEFLVGLATSMEKILPRDTPFDLQPAREIELSLARNEKESFQIAVLPLAGALKQVAVRVGDFDGLEDYAYAVIVEEIVRRREASATALSPAESEWLADAKGALTVPETLVKTMTEYSREPAPLYAWRNRLAELIESSGVADINPWGPNFGVRGLAVRGGRPLTPSLSPTGGEGARSVGEEGRLVSQPIDLLTAQHPDGEFPGWESFHETPGTKTAQVWELQPDGVLVCRGKPRGYLYTERAYQDFTLQFEWRYPRGATNSNGGALVRMTGEHGIWPRCLEFQLNQNQAGDFWAIRGYEFTGPSDQLRVMTNATFGVLRHLKRQADAEKPAGEWNHFEGMVDGGTVIQKVNGTVVNQATGCDVVPGRILFTSEGQEIHLRNVRLVPRR